MSEPRGWAIKNGQLEEAEASESLRLCSGLASVHLGPDGSQRGT